MVESYEKKPDHIAGYGRAFLLGWEKRKAPNCLGAFISGN